MSFSQHKQDLFVLNHFNNKRDGYFVEFGATDGINISNTYLLEKDYSWNGIVAEPAKRWHGVLGQNRKCSVDHRCVWKETGQKIMFNEAPNTDLSTIDQFTHSDLWGNERDSGNRYEVETVSLNDLLISHNAPYNIDYLSIDTEGSEYAILTAFDFTKHRIEIISCEHNKTPMKTTIANFLAAKGYQIVHQTDTEYEDWFILK